MNGRSLIQDASGIEKSIIFDKGLVYDDDSDI